MFDVGIGLPGVNEVLSVQTFCALPQVPGWRLRQEAIERRVVLPAIIVSSKISEAKKNVSNSDTLEILNRIPIHDVFTFM